MAESLGSAVLDLTVDGSDLEDGLSEAESTTESRMGRMGAVVGKGATVAAGALVAVGGAAVGAAFKTASMGDEIAKTAPKLGVTTDELQEMRYWAERNGISSSQMERAVGRLNQRVGDGTAGSSKYVDALNDMGVATLDMNGEVRDTSDVMGDAIQSLSEIEDPSTRSAAAAEIFGTKMARDLMPALQDGALSMDEAAQMAHELGIVMDEDAVASSERFTDAWADVKDAGLGLLNDFGTPVMEFLGDKLLPAITEHVIPALQNFSEWLGPKLSAAAEWLAEVFDEVLLPAFEWVVEKVEPIIDWFSQLGDGTSDLGETMSTVWGTIQDVVGAVADWFGEHVGPLIESVAELVGVAWEKAQDIFETVMEQIRGVWDVIGEPTMVAIEGAWENLKIVADTLWNAIKTIIETVMGVIRGIIDTITALIEGDWDAAWDAILGIVDTIWEGIKSTVETLANAMKNIIDNIMDTIQGLWETAWDAVLTFVTELWDDIKSAVSGAIDDLMEFVLELPDRVKDAVSDAGTWLLEAGKDIIQGMIDGITSMFGKIGETMGDVAGRVRDFLPFSPAKDGPLRTNPPDEAGAKIGEMLADGLASSDDLVAAQMHHLLDGGFDRDAGGGGRHFHLHATTGRTEADLVEQFRRMELVHA